MESRDDVRGGKGGAGDVLREGHGMELDCYGIKRDGTRIFKCEFGFIGAFDPNFLQIRLRTSRLILLE